MLMFTKKGRERAQCTWTNSKPGTKDSPITCFSETFSAFLNENVYHNADKDGLFCSRAT